jgi:2-oxoglutarate dehydrogenase E1 component
VSSLKALANGNFEEVVNDVLPDLKAVETVVLCSGKIYYELIEEREKLQIDTIAFVRLEQLYPLPLKQLEKVLSVYSKNVKLIWAQEEPENMGAWCYILQSLRSWNLDVVSTPASASPAAGSPKVHEKRMKVMMSKVFAYAQVASK